MYAFSIQLALRAPAMRVVVPSPCASYGLSPSELWIDWDLPTFVDTGTDTINTHAAEQVLEKYEVYQRKHVLKIEARSLQTPGIESEALASALRCRRRFRYLCGPMRLTFHCVTPILVQNTSG